MGFKEVSPEQLQADVVEAGGVPFKARVPVDFITPADLRRYLKDVHRRPSTRPRARTPTAAC